MTDNQKLKAKVYKANCLLVEYKLILFTWGNASERTADGNHFIIKPSGVPYEELSPASMVLCDLNGNVVEGDLRPSSDTPTHAYLYKKYPDLKAIVHTHSLYATSWSQAGINLPVLGTTHADTFYGAIICTPSLKAEKIKKNYEYETGVLIADTFAKHNADIFANPAILVKSHGPFVFGEDCLAAAKNAKILEQVANLAWLSLQINPTATPLAQALQDKHYYRKHGDNKYYGQK